MSPERASHVLELYHHKYSERATTLQAPSCADELNACLRNPIDEMLCIPRHRSVKKSPRRKVMTSSPPKSFDTEDIEARIAHF